MAYIITTPENVRSSLKYVESTDDMICHVVDNNHPFFNPPDNPYYDVINNHPELPTIRIWTQEEIDGVNDV